MKLVMIGHGMVGHKCIEAILEDANDTLEVTILAEEPYLAYDRVHLTEYLSGKSVKDLMLCRRDFADAHGIDLRLSTRVIQIDRNQKQVMTEHAEVIAYDKLIIATGSYAFVPPVRGNDRQNCFVYRTLQDLDAIRCASRTAQSGVVIGGGLLGLEAAKALHDLGLATHVVEFAPRLMAVQLDGLAAKMLTTQIEKLGVSVHTEKALTHIDAGQNTTHVLNFSDGFTLAADLVVFSAGIRPRDELAKQCGLAIGERGGIVINDHCQSSDADIYAIGECALWQNKIYGLVAPCYQMATAAAKHILQQAHAGFTGADLSTQLKLLGVEVASIGDAHANTTDAVSYYYVDEAAMIYKKIVVNADKNRLLGAILVGCTQQYPDLLQRMRDATDLPENPIHLILATETSSADSVAMAQTSQQLICSCNHVSKAEICHAIAEGACSIAALKKTTQAATACGGCLPLVTQILKSALVEQGIEIKQHLCEHFAYSRQALYHLVRVHEIKSFDELIQQYGQGLGCDICKPTVANILASCWNDFILQPAHAGLQDSNDYYLANIQKDGSYSVVPRMAGGEVSPKALIRIGEIAQEYGLYTKLTGGQRIDMFGAQIYQLPEIWEKLIQAGFESGHAYGKSLRTVKSCVGQTWCRYGVGDSVALAIFLENRYKGLRSPHKLKMAVSGCTRECAEAQSKDVGVIATEKGWNLYVCGNGGMKPRHAELLASDLDRQTLIRYIDRFLMFYIETADRLQRTAQWRDHIEGGLDYLKKVILDDALGIAAELEQRMQHVIAQYQDEWRTAVENPEIRKRFKTFINHSASQADPHIQFVRVRGQIQPKNQQQDAVQTIPILEI